MNTTTTAILLHSYIIYFLIRKFNPSIIEIKSKDVYPVFPLYFFSPQTRNIWNKSIYFDKKTSNRKIFYFNA